MIKFIAAAAFAAYVSLVPVAAWELQDMNRTVDQTNFIVGEGCSGTLIDLEERLVLTAEHCVSRLTVVIEEDEIAPDGTVTKVKKRYRKPLEVSQPTYDAEGNVTGSRVYRAEIVGTKVSTDLALLKVQGTLSATQASPVLPEGSRLLRGSEAWIVGNPYGNYASVTKGIVSHLKRELPGASGLNNDVKFTQVDGGSAPGNSGGAVYDTEGNLIGVLVRGYPSASHLSFAVDIEDIHEFLENPKGTTDEGPHCC